MAQWIWRRLCATAARKQVSEHWTCNWMNQLMPSWDTRVRAPSWYFRWWVGYLEKKNLAQFSRSLSPFSWPFHLIPASDNEYESPCGPAAVSRFQLQWVCNTKENDSAAVRFVTTGAKLWQTAREFPPSCCLTEVGSSCHCFLRTTHWCLGLFAVTSAQRHRCM